MFLPGASTVMAYGSLKLFLFEVDQVLALADSNSCKLSALSDRRKHEIRHITSALDKNDECIYDLQLYVLFNSISVISG